MCHFDQGEKKKKHKLMGKTFHHMLVSGNRPLNSVCCPHHHLPWQHGGGKAETKAKIRTPAPYTVSVSLGLRLLPCKKETTMLALHGSCKKQRRWQDSRA